MDNEKEELKQELENLKKSYGKTASSIIDEMNEEIVKNEQQLLLYKIQRHFLTGLEEKHRKEIRRIGIISTAAIVGIMLVVGVVIGMLYYMLNK